MGTQLDLDDCAEQSELASAEFAQLRERIERVANDRDEQREIARALELERGAIVGLVRGVSKVSWVIPVLAIIALVARWFGALNWK